MQSWRCFVEEQNCRMKGNTMPISLLFEIIGKEPANIQSLVYGVCAWAILWNAGENHGLNLAIQYTDHNISWCITMKSCYIFLLTAAAIVGAVLLRGFSKQLNERQWEDISESYRQHSAWAKKQLKYQRLKERQLAISLIIAPQTFLWGLSPCIFTII